MIAVKQTANIFLRPETIFVSRRMYLPGIFLPLLEFVSLQLSDFGPEAMFSGVDNRGFLTEEGLGDT